MDQTNDEGIDTAFQIGQKLVEFLGYIPPAEVLNNAAQQNIQSILMTDLSNCNTNLNQNLQVNELEQQNAESCILCLKYDNLSVDEFDQCWKACARYRLTKIKKLASTKSIMETWPFYKTPSGYRLIDIDYKICFDDNDGLILNWEKYFDVLVKLLSSDGHVKDKKIKGLVEKVRDIPDLPENGKNATIFWVLYGYFVPTKLIVVKKDGKKLIPDIQLRTPKNPLYSWEDRNKMWRTTFYISRA